MLKDIIASGESLSELIGVTGSVQLEPEPMPLALKLILIGERLVYYLLGQYDPEFAALFRINADMESKIARTSGNTTACAKRRISPPPRTHPAALPAGDPARTVAGGHRRQPRRPGRWPGSGAARRRQLRPPGVPIRQALAVTGSVNQFGVVQPVGGISDKIEGFFDICAARGLSGEQGVLTPRPNVCHRMLRQEVVDAVRAGRFHIWAVADVDEALELLTGLPAGTPAADGTMPADSVNGRAIAGLRKLAQLRHAFGDGKDAGGEHTTAGTSSSREE